MQIMERLNKLSLEVTSSNSRGQNINNEIKDNEHSVVLASDTLTLSEEGKLKAKSDLQNEEPELPPHIQKILEQIKRLKQSLAEAKQELTAIAQNDAISDEQKTALLAQRQSMVTSLQGALQLASTALREALSGTLGKQP